MLIRTAAALAAVTMAVGACVARNIPSLRIIRHRAQCPAPSARVHPFGLPGHERATHQAKHQLWLRQAAQAVRTYCPTFDQAAGILAVQSGHKS